MRILITNTFLANYTGSELYVRDTALELQRRGHDPVIYSPELGPLAESLRAAGIQAVDDLGKVEQAPDLIHGQHHLETMAALAWFPGIPAVFVCHGWVPWQELPPRHPRILRYVGVSATIRDRMIRLHGIPESRIQVILNFVDLDRFLLRPPLPDFPRQALVFSNQISEANAGRIFRRACAHHGIKPEMVGHVNGNSCTQPELLLPRFDLVFARGRSALEALATGAAVVCCDVEGLGPLVTSHNFAALRQANFGIQVLERPLTEKALRDEIGKYDPLDTAKVSQVVRHTAGLRAAIDEIVNVYNAALDEWRVTSPIGSHSEQQAATHYLKFLSESLRNPARHFSSEATRPPIAAKMPNPLREWGHKRTMDWLIVRHGFKRWLSRRTGRPHRSGNLPANLADSGARHAPSSPQLACVVLSLGNQPTLTQAVKSLLAQEVPVEIVVVNSGGGDPGSTLASAGLQVKVITRERRLFPGAARNVGILATGAPYVAFLAADCVAEEGWIPERLRRHAEGAAAVSSAVTNASPRNLWACVSHLLLFSTRMPGVPAHRALHYGVSYERKLFERYGMFREDLRSGEDSDFNARFAPTIPIAWAPEVRSAHFHPTTVAGLFQDQYARGIRMARTLRQLTGRDHRTIVAGNALARTVNSLRVAWQASRWQERIGLLGAALVVPQAAAAYALGALAGERGQTKRMAAASPPRILALLTFHNEMRYLPDYFRNVAPQVEGIIALDDGSTDGSGEFVAQQPSVIELLRLPARDPHVWDEPRNRRLLVQAAWKHDADWLLVVDADERLERDFRRRANAEIDSAERSGILALRVYCRELWNEPDRFRTDGIWGNKQPVRLFKLRRDHEFDDRPLHGYWAPLNSQVDNNYKSADLIFYHLAMLSPQSRRARQAKYLRLDPDRRHQAIGYDYMTDEIDLQLAQILAGRDFEPPLAPSGVVSAPRIFALLVFHNEMSYLEDYFHNVSPQVDGIVALDDGSTDGSGEFVNRQPSVIELIRLPVRSPHVWNESANHRSVVEAAFKHGPDWLIAVDADERLERNFRARAIAEIAKAEQLGIRALGVKLRELWDSPRHYRADGIWGKKSTARFFKARMDHEFDPRLFHGHWAPLNSKHNGGFPESDLILYHLRMIHPADRIRRRERYRELDPEKQWRPMGYDYLADETDLRLIPVPPGRDYEPIPTTPEALPAATR
jgi:glycosyltransferase involved in cell wall biosynthesis